MQVMSIKREEKIFKETLWYALEAPFVFAPDWGDFPKATLEMAKLYRLAESVKLYDSKMCSDFEVMLYLSGMSHIAPLAREYYKMCMFCMKKYYGLEKIESDPERLRWLERDTELDDQELYEFNKLKSTIYRRQIAKLQ